jgi:hypothetical protein
MDNFIHVDLAKTFNLNRVTSEDSPMLAFDVNTYFGNILNIPLPKSTHTHKYFAGTSISTFSVKRAIKIFTKRERVRENRERSRRNY